MKAISLTGREGKVLLSLAAFGFIVPNGIFLYFIFTSPETSRAAFTNPISLVFIAEAFVLMFLFAWLLRRAGVRRPTGLMFVVMSLVGSMVFSVPAALYMALRNQDSE